MADEERELRRARAYLSRVTEPAGIGVWSFVREHGAVAAADALRRERAPARLLAETASRRAAADPDADLAAAERHGVRLVTPEDDSWPHFAFAALERGAEVCATAYAAGRFARNESGDPVPPLALWVRGDSTTVELASVGVRSVGVVGSRAATSYGEHVTAELSYSLASRGVVVVSGGAHGIDAAAHRAALAAGGGTVLVSAGGLDAAYPPANAALFERVAEHGLLISESPPGCAPQRRRFLTRNRLIAALSTGVVVVEAAARSGAANTATHARTLGRPVMAVPGPVTSPMSAGTHALLRRDPDPAILVTSGADVLAVVGSVGEGLDLEGDRSVRDVRDELDQLSPAARAVFDGLLARRFAGPDEVAVRSGLSALDVVRALPELDRAGLIESRDGMVRVAATRRSARPPPAATNRVATCHAAGDVAPSHP